MGADENQGQGSGEGAGGGEVAFTEAQKAEMIRLHNAANSAHHSRISKIMDQRFDELRESMTASVSEMLKSLKPEGAGANGANGAQAGNGATGDDAAAQIRKEYEARMSEMEKRFEAEKQARVQEHERNQRNEERSKLDQALRAAGVPDERIRSAVALLYTEDKRVARDDDNGIVFKVQRDGYVDKLPLDNGVEEWLKSPEGKHFAPSRDVRGSGATGGTTRTTSGGKPSKAELKRNLVTAILNAERGG